jgi:3-oxoacyl-[acyl-carrier protein] reductase
MGSSSHAVDGEFSVGQIAEARPMRTFEIFAAVSVYGATKAAASGFTRSLAREVGKLGLTVNAIAPGFVDTELTQSLSEDQRNRIAGRSSLRRLAEPDDVARMVEYLLGDGGRNVTGSVLTIDAGNTA